MTTFNIDVDRNFDDVIGSTLVGADTYNLNGSIFTVDTDTRYCANRKNTTGNIGGGSSAINISVALGGQFKIDGTKTKLLPYYGGSGTMQAITSDQGVGITAATWAAGTATITCAAITTADTVTTTTAATTCTRATGSFIADGITVGMIFGPQTGATIPANTYVASVNSATSITLSQAITTGAAAVATFNKASTWAVGNTVTIDGCIPSTWNGTYVVASQSGSQFTVAMTNDPGTIVVKGSATRRYMVTQNITKTPTAYSTTGSGPYITTVTCPNHNFAVGNTITFAGVTNSGTAINGAQTVSAVINKDQFQFSMASNPGSVSVVGTVSKTVSAEQLSVWNAQTAVGTSHTVATAGTQFVATVTTTHALQPGDWVTFQGVTPAALNGTYKVETITGTTSFTYLRNDNPGNATVQGFHTCLTRSLTLAASGTPGTAINATGFFKVKRITNGPFENGTLTLEGGTSPVATAASAELTAPIEIVAPDSGKMVVPRQGKFVCQGDWFYQPQAPFFTTALTVSGSSGAWTCTATLAAYSGGAAQLHRLYVGQEVLVCGVSGGEHNGRFRITSTTATTITYTNTSTTTLANATVQGTVTPFTCTNGLNTKQFALPFSAASFIGGVWVEKYPGADTGDGSNSAYDFYPSMGGLVTASSVGTDYARGRVCFITSAGILRFGHDGTQAQGYTPLPGCKIRYPNVITVGITAGTPQTNTINTTIATRFGFTTSGAGYISIDKANIYWALNVGQPYYVGLTNSTVVDNVTISEVGAPIAWDNVIIGPSGTAVATTNTPLNISTCWAGGTITNSSITNYASVATSATTGCACVLLTNCDGFSITNSEIRAGLLANFNVTAANQILTPWLSNAIYALNQTNFTTNNLSIMGGGKVYFGGGSSITMTNTKYTYSNASNYSSSLLINAFEFATKAKDIKLDGFNFPKTNISSMSCTSNVVTCTTDRPHGYAASSVVDVTGCSSYLYNAHSVTLSLVTRTTVASCTTVVGSNIITTSNNFNAVGVLPGDLITLTNVPAGTYVESVTNNTTLVMTQAATGAAANTATFTVPNKFTYPKTAADIGATSQTTMGVNLANVTMPMSGVVLNTTCDNIKLRNFGTSFLDRLNIGTTSASNFPAFFYQGVTSALNVEIKRIYTAPYRTGVLGVLNALSGITSENVFASQPIEMTAAPTGFNRSTVTQNNLNAYSKGVSWYHTVPATTALAQSIYGTHFLDNFMTLGDAQINIQGNETTTSTLSYVTKNPSNSAQSGFNSLGAFVMPKANDEIVWNWPNKIIGHTGFKTECPGSMLTAIPGTSTTTGVAAALSLAAGGTAWTAVTMTGNTNSSVTVTNITNTDQLYAGCPVTGSGFQTDTYIASVDSTTQITLTKATTSTLVGTAITYGYETTLVTSANHRLTVGDTVNIVGTTAVNATYYGVFTVSGFGATPATQFKIRSSYNPGGTLPTAGTVIVPYIAITGMAYSAPTLTVTTSFAHGFQPGDVVNIQDAMFTAGTPIPANCNGTFTIVTVPSLTTFTITAPGNPGTTNTANTGTIRPHDNVRLYYDIDATGSYKSLRIPIWNCATPATSDGVVTTSDTSMLAVGDWVFGKNIAAGGAKITAINPNVSFTLGRNNVSAAGVGSANSATTSNFVLYATKIPNTVVTDPSVGFNFKVKATTISKNSVTALTNITTFTSSSQTAQAYQYPLDQLTITLSNVVVGSRYRIDNMTSGTAVYVTDGTAASSTVTGTFAVSQGDTLRIRVRKTSSAPKYQEFETNTVVGATGASVYVSQILDTIVT